MKTKRTVTPRRTKKEFCNRKFRDHPCRVCGKVPEDGYYHSKILRSDWICPDCCNKQVKKQREDKAKEEGF